MNPATEMRWNWIQTMMPRWLFNSPCTYSRLSRIHYLLNQFSSSWDLAKVRFNHHTSSSGLLCVWLEHTAYTTVQTSDSRYEWRKTTKKCGDCWFPFSDKTHKIYACLQTHMYTIALVANARYKPTRNAQNDSSSFNTVQILQPKSVNGRRIVITPTRYTQIIW